MDDISKREQIEYLWTVFKTHAKNPKMTALDVIVAVVQGYRYVMWDIEEPEDESPS